jgi:hypothetical protein
MPRHSMHSHLIYQIPPPPPWHRYTEYVVKGEMVNTLCGFPIEHTGGHIAIRHDSRMHMENTARRIVTMLKSACVKVVCPRVRSSH